MKIEITQEAAEMMLKLNDRYFFGLFEEIATNEEEEEWLRDAIEEIATAIKEA